MNFEDFKENPAIKADLPKVIRPIEAFLVDHLIETAAGGNPDAETAEAQVGASKAIANLIILFRAAARPSVEAKKPVKLKGLHRFSKTPEAGGEPNIEP